MLLLPLNVVGISLFVLIGVELFFGGRFELGATSGFDRVLTPDTGELVFAGLQLGQTKMLASSREYFVFPHVRWHHLWHFAPPLFLVTF